jgi:hypothetical protein
VILAFTDHVRGNDSTKSPHSGGIDFLSAELPGRQDDLSLLVIHLKHVSKHLFVPSVLGDTQNFAAVAGRSQVNLRLQRKLAGRATNTPH